MGNIARWGPRRRARWMRRGWRSGDSQTARRYQIVGLLTSGIAAGQVATLVACARSTVFVVRARFNEFGEAGLVDRRISNGRRKTGDQLLADAKRVLSGRPPQFGWRRPTWTRELLARTLASRGHPTISVATMSRVLQRIGARHGRPKPIVGCPWPAAQRDARLAELRALREASSASEPVLYTDEVDIHLNPKIGADWMLRGQQRRVMTPGKNQKHYVAGALHAQSRRLIWVDGPSKCSGLFCKMVWAIMKAHRRARRVHLILDNYIIHRSKETQKFLVQFGSRLALHFLPPYCPDDNLIEREWQNFHANVTRNHNHRTMIDLLLYSFAYFEERAYRTSKLSLLPAFESAA